MTDTARRPDETETQYIWRICSAKDNGVLDMTWDEVANILNKELRGEDEWYTQSAYRKKYQMAKLFRDEVFSKESSEYEEQKRELQQLKIQYRDERNAWNRQNYMAARVNQDLEYLGEQLQQIGRQNFQIDVKQNESGDNRMVVCLSDLHIGQTFANVFGQYNSDIAKARLEKYAQEVVRIGKKNNVKTVHIALLGDLISSNIRLSIQVSNRENIIDQVKLSAEYIASFISTVAENFESVEVAGVSGNHSRLISSKENDIKDERLDHLILWICQKMLSHIPNVSIDETNIDTSLGIMKVGHRTYCLVHGDVDNLSPTNVSNIITMLKFFPYAILNGHKHTPSYKEINGIKCIQSASLAGSGDDYTITCRLSGEPNQTVLVCDYMGDIECIYNIELS